MEPKPAPAAAKSKISRLLFEKVVDLPSERINVVIRHVTLPVGFKTPAHTHKGPGPRYVLKGKVEIVEGADIRTVSEGEVFWESGAIMTAENVSEGPMELVAFQFLPVE
ncbi:MAG: cupin domain-containing protein [Nitrospinae bacterium]|nr:cupin domain-containing protein [Nitrospinota bacterium]